MAAAIRGEIGVADSVRKAAMNRRTPRTNRRKTPSIVTELTIDAPPAPV
jgi:hypothetical protein